MKIPNDMNYLVLINRSGKQAFRESELAEKKKNYTHLIKESN